MSVEALVFDAYGTLYDVHSVIRRCETCFPGKGTQLSQLWRAKQLEYTWQRSLMQRYVPFSQVTREALAYSCAALGLSHREHEEALMAEYVHLAPFPEVRAALERLKVKRAILSNGSPDLLEVHDVHFDGTAPSGRFEDFHGVHLVFRGHRLHRFVVDPVHGGVS